MQPPGIRYMAPVDADAAAEIDAASDPSPWRAREFRRAPGEAGIRGVVACAPGTGEVVGFAVYRNRGAALTLLRLAVAPDWRRRGVGRALLRHVVGKLPRLGDAAIDAIVREHAEAAIALLRSEGFRGVAPVHRRHFPDGEDGWSFRLHRDRDALCAGAGRPGARRRPA